MPTRSSIVRLKTKQIFKDFWRNESYNKYCQRKIKTRGSIHGMHVTRLCTKNTGVTYRMLNLFTELIVLSRDII